MSEPLGYDGHGTPIYEGDIVVHFGERLIVMDGSEDGRKVFAQDPELERRPCYWSWIRCSSTLVDVKASPDRGER